MRLYIGNLPFQATDAEVRNFFEREGFALDNFTLTRDRISAPLRIGERYIGIVLDAIENREGGRAEAIMREHARLAARNLRAALKNRTHLDLLPASALIKATPFV